MRVSREFRELSLSRAERGPGFSPQSLARLAQDNESWLKVVVQAQETAISERLGHPLFFLRLPSSSRPKFLAFSKKKIKSNDVDTPFLT